MSRKSIKKTLLLLTACSMLPHHNYAGAGKSFGLFAGGAVAGGLIGSAIAKRNRPRERARVIETERIVEQPVYVQAQPVINQPQVLQPTKTEMQASTEIAQLKSYLSQQDERIRRLEQELKAKRKAASKHQKISGKVKPTSESQLKKDIFDEFEPED